jgi:hypothetical protein
LNDATIISQFQNFLELNNGPIYIAEKANLAAADFSMIVVHSIGISSASKQGGI